MKKKTILVIFTNVARDIKSISHTDKKYPFNTESEVSVGDLIESKSYSNSKMQVVAILDEAYTYFNSNTGQLSNKMDSTSQWKIKDLKIVESGDDETVIATKVVVK